MLEDVDAGAETNLWFLHKTLALGGLRGKSQMAIIDRDGDSQRGSYFFVAPPKDRELPLGAYVFCSTSKIRLHLQQKSGR